MLLFPAGVFFYLDAHGEEYLPLKEEIRIICKHWREAVIMVDDFEVPNTTYAFDDYGKGQRLSLDYLAPLSDLELGKFFPAKEAEFETGPRRGCIVLSKESSMTEALKTLSTLKYHEA